MDNYKAANLGISQNCKTISEQLLVNIDGERCAVLSGYHRSNHHEENAKTMKTGVTSWHTRISLSQTSIVLVVVIFVAVLADRDP